jgi:3-hydroxyacyl-CoA dehydrogenase/3a,7a,12a-trihydroxy-5b-cholest-24-enoyl-CoA hydratase
LPLFPFFFLLFRVHFFSFPFFFFPASSTQVAALKPDYVAPLVGYLCHESSKVNGGIFEVGAGWISRVRWQRTQGAFFDVKKGFTPEMVRDGWSKVDDWSNPTVPVSTTENMTL